MDQELFFTDRSFTTTAQQDDLVSLPNQTAAAAAHFLLWLSSFQSNATLLSFSSTIQWMFPCVTSSLLHTLSSSSSSSSLSLWMTRMTILLLEQDSPGEMNEADDEQKLDDFDTNRMNGAIMEDDRLYSSNNDSVDTQFDAKMTTIESVIAHGGDDDENDGTMMICTTVWHHIWESFWLAWMVILTAFVFIKFGLACWNICSSNRQQEQQLLQGKQRQGKNRFYVDVQDEDGVDLDMELSFDDTVSMVAKQMMQQELLDQQQRQQSAQQQQQQQSSPLDSFFFANNNNTSGRTTRTFCVQLQKSETATTQRKQQEPWLKACWLSLQFIPVTNENNPYDFYVPPVSNNNSFDDDEDDSDNDDESEASSDDEEEEGGFDFRTPFSICYYKDNTHNHHRKDRSKKNSNNGKNNKKTNHPGGWVVRGSRIIDHSKTTTKHNTNAVSLSVSSRRRQRQQQQQKQQQQECCLIRQGWISPTTGRAFWVEQGYEREVLYVGQFVVTTQQQPQARPIVSFVNGEWASSWGERGTFQRFVDQQQQQPLAAVAALQRQRSHDDDEDVDFRDSSSSSQHYLFYDDDDEDFQVGGLAS